ncbi:MAG: hypothetical protein ACXVWU_10370, partial [Nocardioides sp.]
ASTARDTWCREAEERCSVMELFDQGPPTFPQVKPGFPQKSEKKESKEMKPDDGDHDGRPEEAASRPAASGGALIGTRGDHVSQ